MNFGVGVQYVNNEFNCGQLYSMMGCVLFLEVLYDISLVLVVIVGVGGEVYVYVLGFRVFKYVDFRE